MKINLRFLVSICLVTGAIHVNGQNQPVLPQVAPKSPNVAGFEKYGEVPVSMNTGVPNISIPLTSISVDGLTIPITLSYHNTGLKVEELSSWVGYGWNLEAGGMISWQTQGLSDFDQVHNGLYYAYQPLSNYFRGAMNATQQYNFFESILNEEQDSQFDKFSMNFLNYNYSFYFDTLQQPRIMPRADLKIIKTTEGFKVIDLAGNQFYFETMENGEVHDAGDVEIRPGALSAAYYLSRITTRNGRLIRFTYRFYSLQYTKNNVIKRFVPTVSNPSGCPESGPEASSTYIYQEYLLPDSIVYDGGYVKFNRTAGNRQDFSSFNTTGIPALSDLKVVNSAGKVTSQFFFTQSYFGSNVKLKLSSIQEQVGAVTGRRWDFKYWGEGDNFPDFFSTSIDHWGYYNGKQNLSGLFPKADYGYLIGSVSQGDADRTSDFRFSKLGLLQTIRYPTGGTSYFEYEPNQVKVRNRSEIYTISPFLQWPENTFPVVTVPIASGNSADQSYSGNFSLSSNSVVQFGFYRQLDPGHVSDAYITFSGPQTGVDALNYAMNVICGPGSCTNQTTVGLPPGSYSYICNSGQNTNDNTPLVSNFDIVLKYDDTTVIPPFEAAGARIKQVISTDSTGINPGMVKRYVYADSLNQVTFRNPPYYITSMTPRISVNFLTCTDCNIQYTITGESVVPFAGSNIEYTNVTELYDSTGSGGKIEYTFLSSTNEGGSIYAQPRTTPFNTSWRAGNLARQKTYKFQNNVFSLVEEQSNGYHLATGQHEVRGIKVEYQAYCINSNPTDRQHRIGLGTLFTEQFYKNQSVRKQYLGGQLVDTQNIAALSVNHLLPTSEEKFDSRHQSIRELSTYPLDYTNRNLATTSEALGIKLLANANIFEPVEKIQVKKINGVDYVISGTITTYSPDKPLAAKIFTIKKNALIPYASFVKSTINGSGVFVRDANYEERIVFNKYDAVGNVSELYKKDDLPIAYIWDYKKMYPTAEVKNADSNSIAYTSFEADGTGNWTTAGGVLIAGDGVTGSSCYQLTAGNITKAALSAGTTYIVSYWTKNASPFTVAGTQGTALQTRTVGLWKCYVHRVSGITQASVSGSGFVDEVRLFPATAQMTTFCYEPGMGVINTNDPNNNITTYEYDVLGRLALIRNQDRNIVKKVDYQYRQQP